jgi:hypothetical protein
MRTQTHSNAFSQSYNVAAGVLERQNRQLRFSMSSFALLPIFAQSLSKSPSIAHDFMQKF